MPRRTRCAIAPGKVLPDCEGDEAVLDKDEDGSRSALKKPEVPGIATSTPCVAASGERKAGAGWPREMSLGPAGEEEEEGKRREERWWVNHHLHHQDP